MLTLALGGCRNRVEVRTVAAPDANFAGRRTFRILPTPVPTGVTLGASDPMLTNSITYQAIRAELRSAFESRGYQLSPQGADLDVAYYATAQSVLELHTYNYGYDWRGFPREYTQIDQYEQGTVIIDVIDPATHRLMWRGEGKAAVSTDPEKYANTLRKAVREIVKRFPAASY
jgi:hypothetical protein